MIHQHHGLEGRNIAIELLGLGGDSLEKALRRASRARVQISGQHSALTSSRVREPYLYPVGPLLSPPLTFSVYE